MKKVVWTGMLVVMGLALAGVGVWAQTPQSVEARRQARVERMQQMGERIRARVDSRVQKRMEQVDRNHDRAITKDEWPRAARRFDRLDRNHDGALTQDELTQGAMARRIRVRRAAMRLQRMKRRG